MEGSGGHSTTQQRSSTAAASSSTEGIGLTIAFTQEENLQFNEEVNRLSLHSVICRVLGSRPSRGELRDLLQGTLQAEIGKVCEVHFMGRGFYHVELETPESVSKVLAMSPLDLRGARAVMYSWEPGFDPSGKMSFPITVIFPGIRREYFPMLTSVASKIGAVLEYSNNRLGLPSRRILVQSLSELPTKIFLPKVDGSKLEQKVEYVGLPNQCFYCRHVGHMAKECSKREYQFKTYANMGKLATKISQWKGLDRKRLSIKEKPIRNGFQ